MPRLRDNLLANFAAQGWAALMAIAFVPAYLSALGAARFGLVAFMASLQAIAALLDLGAATFLGRELARREGSPAGRASQGTLLRSFEWLAWPMALAIGIVLLAAAPMIAADWLDAAGIPDGELGAALAWIAVAVAAQWPASLYGAVLIGLERQAHLSAILAVSATVRYGGALVVLWLGAGVLGFLAWQAAVSALQTAATGWLAWRLVPADAERRFRGQEIRGAMRFAFGVFSISALGILLSQMDRLALSALRPLAELGQYAVAISVSGVLTKLAQPVFTAIYPRFSRLLALGDTRDLAGLIHLATQLLATLCLGSAAFVAFFGRDVIAAWTGDAALSREIDAPLALVFAGTALNAAILVPYALQLAQGRTGPALAGNSIAVLAGLPVLVHVVPSSGMTGAAATWLGINLAYLAAYPPIAFRSLGATFLARWWCLDLIAPALASVATCLLLTQVLPRPPDGSPIALGWMAMSAAAAMAAAALAASRLRAYVRTQFARAYRGRGRSKAA